MSYNILIVDDSNIVRKVLIKTLNIAGLPINQIVEAKNGQQALDLLKDNWIDLIFLDINMPIMNGMEFMQHIRESHDYDETPIIIVSTEGSKERQHELFDKNIKAYLRKPITPKMLANKINKILGGQDS
ncbi:MAG: response regulator [Deltaproteobacteria bacterium]|nr:response regulator [Deltaproteobacteria bacterium]